MKSRFLVLDSFRGLAAICVVLHHMHIVGSLTEIEFFRGSFIFVDFFFVLSGFVLAHGYGWSPKLDFSLFIKKRFFRLYPLHLFTLFGFISVELFRLIVEVLTGYQFNISPFVGPLAVKEIIPNLLLLQSWLPFADSFSFNAPAWSISVEFYLYILLFLSVAVTSKGKVEIWVIFTLLSLYLIATGSTVTSTEVLRGFRGFFGGALMYVAFLQLQRINLARYLQRKLAMCLMTGLELLLVALIIFTVSSIASPQSMGILLLFFITVLVFSFEAGAFSIVLRYTLFQYLGRISYSIYLMHSLIFLFINLVLIALQKYTDSINLTFVELGVRYIDSGYVWVNQLILLLMLVLVVVASHITYRFIELRWQYKKLPS